MKTIFNIKLIAIISMSFTVSIAAFGQQTEKTIDLPNPPQNVIALVPFYSFYNGIRIDYERRLNKSDHWIVAAPQIYTDIDGSGSGNSEYAAYQTMGGVGINLYFKSIAYKSNKINWKSSLPRQSLYLQVGPNYQHFSLKNTEEVAVPFIEDGTTYYMFETQEIKKKINRVGAIVDVGWQLAFDKFLIDFYLGLAVKYSFDENGDLIKSTNARWVDINYSGILMDAGFRVGMFF